MANGGVVPDLELPSDSLQTSLVSPLLLEEESTASGTLEANLFPEGYKDQLKGEQASLTPRSLDGIPEDLQEAYGFKESEFNPPVFNTPVPKEPTPMYVPSLSTPGETYLRQPDQGEIDNYYADVDLYKSERESYIEEYDGAVANFNLKQSEKTKNLIPFFREIDFNTVGTLFNNEYDLSKVKLSKKRLPVNLGYGESERGSVEWGDLFGAEETIESFTGKLRKEILLDSEAVIAHYQKTIDELTGKGLSKNELAARARQAGSLEEETKKQERIKELTGFIETGKLSEDAIAQQMKLRGGAAIDNLIMQKVALSPEAWAASISTKKGETYKNYLERLEDRIFNDSVKDPKLMELSHELFGEQQQEGVIAIRPYLGGPVSIGEWTKRDEYWSQFGLNTEIGWWDALRGMSLWGNALKEFEYRFSSMGDEGFVMSEEQKFDRKLEREKAIEYQEVLEKKKASLSKAVTQIALSEDILLEFGETAFYNRDHITEREVGALTDAMSLAYRTEIAMPSVRSAPLSLLTQVMSIPAYAKGGMYAGFAFQSTLMGGVAGSTYYNDVLSNNRLYGGLSESQKMWYAFSHGAAEFGGELAGNILIGKALGIGKVGGRFSLYNRFKGANFAGKTMVPIKRSMGQQFGNTVKNIVVGTAFAAGAGYVEERLEETITGYWQKANDRSALGLDFDHWINWDEANHAGRIGGHMGVFFGVGIRTAQNTAALYQRAMDGASFDRNSRSSLLNQIGNDWGQGLTKSEWTEIKKTLNDMGITPGMSPLAHAGVLGKPENKEKVARINELMESFEGKNKAISELLDEASGPHTREHTSLLAALVIESNLSKMNAALGIEVSRNSAGRLVDQYGSFLPNEWESSYFGKEGVKLTPEERKAKQKQKRIHDGRLKMFQFMLKNNLISQGFRTSGLSTQEETVDRTKTPLDLKDATLLSGAISDDIRASLKEAGMSEEVINQFNAILKKNPDVEIIAHTTMDSMNRVSSGAEGLYIETETGGVYDREGNITKKKELHVYVGEGADISRVLTHEYGHLAFERFINGELVLSEESWNSLEKKDEETYAEHVQKQKDQGEKFLNAMAQQIIEMKDPKIQEIVEFTFRAEGKNLSEEAKRILNKELVDNFMEAIARGEFIRRNTDGGLEYNVQGVSLKSSDMGFKNWGKKLLMDFGFKGDLNFSQEEDVIMLAIKFSQRARALGLQKGKSSTEAKIDIDKAEAADTVTEAELTRQAEDATGLKSKRVDPADIDFSQGGITLYYTQNVIGQKRGVYAPIFVETDRDGEIKDRAWFKPIESKSHLEYWYAGKTGNSIARVAISDLHYYDGDTRVDINSPDVVKKYGKPVFRSLPTTVSDLKIKKRKRVAKDRDALISERDKLSQHMGNIHFDSDKKLNWNTNANDFLPIPKEIGTAMPEGTTEQIEKDIENYTIGIANVEALIESDLGQAELAEMAGGKTENIDTSKYPEVFNMSGLRMSETFEEKAVRINDEIQDFGQPWQLLPKDSPSYKNRIPDLRIASQEELDYAADRMDRLKAGEFLEGDLLDVDLTDGIGLASSRVDLNKKNDLFSNEVTADNIQKFLNGEIKSGRIGSYDDLMKLLKDLGIKPYISLHNIDRTLTGEGSLTFKIGRSGASRSFPFFLPGGPHGSAQMAVDGSDIGHTNTKMGSSMQVETFAMAVNMKNKDKKESRPYFLGLSLLNEENSLKNPKVFSVVNQFLKHYLSEANKTLDQKFDEEKELKSSYDIAVSEVLNSFFEKQIPKSSKKEAKELDPKAPTPQWVKVVSRPRSTYGQVFAGFTEIQALIDNKDVDTSDYGIKIKTTKGLNQILDFLSGQLQVGGKSYELSMDRLTNATSFNVRGDFANHVFGKSIGMRGRDSGFPSKDEFLDAINQPEYKGVKSGSVTSLTSIDTNKAKRIDDVSLLLRTQTDESSMSRKIADNIAYKYGVRGHKTVFNFESPVDNGVIFEMTPRQSTSGLLAVYKGLKSSRLPGRIYTSGNSAWEQSTATPYGEVLQKAARIFQDKFSDVMLLQQDVEIFRGSKVPQSQDFEMSMDLMYGMIRTDLERLEVELDKINEAVKDAGYTAEMVSDYLYAKHAPERNAFIQDKRPEMESGSGMTTQEAEEIINELETPEMIVISKLVYDIISNTRQTMREGGLEKASTIETWEGLYKNYIPLSGRAADEMDDDNNSYPTGGAGMAVYGTTTKAAKGRPSKTGVNLIANAIMQNAMVKQRARKDQAMMSMYSLVKNNANEKVWGVFSGKNPKMKLDETGQMVPMNAFEMKASRNMVPIRINGEQHFIYFKKSEYADALNGQTGEKLSSVAKTLAPLMGFMRNSFTQYNPAFFLTNYSRDLHGAMYNALAEVEREGGIMQGYNINSKKFTKDVILGSTVTLRALLNESAFGREMTPEMAEYLEEWRAAGGRTGFSYSESINNVMESMRTKAETKSGVKEAAEYTFKKPIQFFEYVSAQNESFENSIRLSAYIEARKVGVTKQRAAQLSKNITINFNKSGELGPTLNSMFLFFNASVQGVTRFGRTFQQGKAGRDLWKEIKEELPDNPDELKSWKTRISSAQKLAAGSVLFSAMQTMINMAISDRDDDDDELVYNKYPDYKKERGFQIMYDGRNSFSVPLGYGYNVFNIAGVMLAEVAAGQRSVEDAATFMAIAGHGSFSPIAFGHSETLGGSIVKGVTPTVLKSPLDAFGFNETYFGTPVYKEQYPWGAEAPESQLSFRSPELVQQAATALSEMTGGTENISGGVEINPDPWYYIMQSYWGGAGDFVEETAGMGKAGFEVGRRKYNKLAASMNTDEFVDNLLSTPKEDTPIIKFSDVPILKSMYGGPSRFYDFDLLEKNRGDIEQHVKELSKNVGQDISHINFTGVQALKDELKKTDDALKQVWAARRAAKDIEDYIDRSNAGYMLQEAERKVVMRFNAIYYQLRGQYVDPKPQGIIPLNDIRKAIGTDE